MPLGCATKLTGTHAVTLERDMLLHLMLSPFVMCIQAWQVFSAATAASTSVSSMLFRPIVLGGLCIQSIHVQRIFL